MKNVIKKISAAAMAFALLGAGTIITNRIAPQSDTTLTANAAVNNTCNHRTFHREWTEGCRTYFVDFCYICGTEFGRGSKACPPFNPYPADPFVLLK